MIKELLVSSLLLASFQVSANKPNDINEHFAIDIDKCSIESINGEKKTICNIVIDNAEFDVSIKLTLDNKNLKEKLIKGEE